MPGLNPLVDKIRAQYPGAYDDMDDAALTKSVLAKYPQYSDLAAPKLTVGAPSNVNVHGVGPFDDGSLKGPKVPPLGGKVPQSIINAPDSVGDTIGGLTIGGTAAMAASPALPFVRKLAAKQPVISTMAGIQAAKKIPVVGPYIEKIPGIDFLPFLLGMGSGKGESAAEKETLQSPSTDQMPGRPYQPNPRYTPPPEPEPLPQRTGPLLLKGQVQEPVPTKMSKLPWMPELEKSLGNEPLQVKPGVPIKNQPRISSAVKDYSYDSDAREFHVQPTGGSTGYIYGDVSPEDAQAFHNAESKGQAWQQMRNNPLVGKVVNGKRVDVKPVSRNAGNDLTDILTQSLRQAQGAK